MPVWLLIYPRHAQKLMSPRAGLGITVAEVQHRTLIWGVSGLPVSLFGKLLIYAHPPRGGIVGTQTAFHLAFEAVLSSRYQIVAGSSLIWSVCCSIFDLLFARIQSHQFNEVAMTITQSLLVLTLLAIVERLYLRHPLGMIVRNCCWDAAIIACGSLLMLVGTCYFIVVLLFDLVPLQYATAALCWLLQNQWFLHCIPLQVSCVVAARRVWRSQRWVCWFSDAVRCKKAKS